MTMGVMSRPETSKSCPILDGKLCSSRSGTPAQISIASHLDELSCHLEGLPGKVARNTVQYTYTQTSSPSLLLSNRWNTVCNLALRLSAGKLSQLPRASRRCSSSGVGASVARARASTRLSSGFLGKFDFRLDRALAVSFSSGRTSSMQPCRNRGMRSDPRTTVLTVLVCGVGCRSQCWACALVEQSYAGADRGRRA